MEVVQAGDERDLPLVVRSLIFGIVHNAMTHVLLHAKASRVEVRLDFQADQLCLTVSDDGIGIPQEGGRWGHGLRNMGVSAERMGGRLAKALAKPLHRVLLAVGSPDNCGWACSHVC